MSKDVGIWLVIYVIATLGFSLAFSILLGTTSYSFRTWGVSM